MLWKLGEANYRQMVLGFEFLYGRRWLRWSRLEAGYCSCSRVRIAERGTVPGIPSWWRVASTATAAAEAARTGWRHPRRIAGRSTAAECRSSSRGCGFQRRHCRHRRHLRRRSVRRDVHGEARRRGADWRWQRRRWPSRSCRAADYRRSCVAGGAWPWRRWRRPAARWRPRERRWRQPSTPDSPTADRCFRRLKCTQLNQ